MGTMKLLPLLLLLALSLWILCSSAEAEYYDIEVVVSTQACPDVENVEWHPSWKTPIPIDGFEWSIVTDTQSYCYDRDGDVGFYAFRKKALTNWRATNVE